MATISNNQIAQAIYLASLDAGSRDQKVFLKNIVNFLSKKKLLSRSSLILEKLEETVNKGEDRLMVKVGSAVKLDEKTKISILHSLKHKYKVKEVALKEVVDDRLIGGLRFEIGNEVIDLTVRNRMNKLQEHLIKN
jgi:F-type H+-transporting ATPase subunit delta